MNSLIAMTSEITMGTREIAEMLGKNHSDIKRSAERLSSAGILTQPMAESPFEHKDLHRPAMDIIREKVQAEQQRDELLAELEEARQMVVDWSNYASDYFKEKHCLANDIAQLDAAIAKAKAAQAGEKI